jgi:hypothetical protein
MLSSDVFGQKEREETAKMTADRATEIGAA